MYIIGLILKVMPLPEHISIMWLCFLPHDVRMERPEHDVGK